MSCALLRLASGPRARPRRLRAAATASTACSAAPLQRGVVLGVHTEEGREGFTLTEQAAAFDRNVSGRFSALLKLGPPLAAGQARVLWGVDGAHAAVAAAGLGARAPPDEPHEGIDRRAENVRLAAGAGCRALREAGARAVLVDAMGAARAAAEGATLAAYRYQEYRQEKKRKHVPAVSPLAECDAGEWSLGAEGAGSQNWSRTLMERPGNKLTPTEMARVVSAELSALSVKCLSRDRAWAESMNMNCFLSVSRGSAEPPVFLELHYDGPASKAAQPIVLVGKGVTFDSGGISIKPSAKMAEMRGDMGGAAVVCGAIRAAAALRLPVKLIGLIPLTENMPGGAATKPGDVFVARNGKSVLVDNTDAEGRLILADALCYAHDFDPLVTVDLATLTGAMRVALGDAASGLFTRDERLASALRRAAAQSADRVWRMPLYQRYTDRVTGYEYVDVHNVGKGSGGGACTAAAFLREFAPARWAHLDIAGVMADTEDQPYLGPGMTGRPLRTILEFVRTFNEQK